MRASNPSQVAWLEEVDHSNKLWKALIIAKKMAGIRYLVSPRGT
jgi:hypothetical protein